MNCTNEYISQMVCDRRRIHKRPEEGWTEFETTAFVAQRLRALGLKVLLGPKIINKDFVMGRNPDLVAKAMERAKAHGVSSELLDEMQGYTGVVGILETGRPGPVTAFRVDLDCVCVQETADPHHEANAGGYASERLNLMHACGHDGHTAVALSTAAWAKAHESELKGTLKFLFQPAEEGTRGAEPMAESGIVDDVDFLICSHIGTGYKVGEMCVCRTGFLATTKMDVHFLGRAAHACTAPEKGRSALLAACSAAVMMAGIPRSGQGDTRISIGRINAGEGRNVVPVNGLLQLETRGSSEEVNNFMVDNVRRIVEGVARAYEVQAEIEQVGHATTLIADESVTNELLEIARSIPFFTKTEINNNIKGSEDCTLLVKRVNEHGGKCGFFIFGCNEHGHHKGDFCIQDEQSLKEAFEIDTRFIALKNSL